MTQRKSIFSNIQKGLIIFDLVVVLLAATMFFQREDYIVLPFFWLIGTNRIKSHQHTFLILIFTRTRLHCQIPRILVSMLCYFAFISGLRKDVLINIFYARFS